MSFIKKSPWVIHYDGSSCNGCDIAFAHHKPELRLREVGPQGCKVGLGLGCCDPRTPLPAKFKLLANRQGDLCRT